MDNKNTIPDNLRSDVVRNLIENRNTLAQKGALYVGTGNSQEFDGTSCAETTSITPPTENYSVLVSDSTSADGGLKWEKMTDAISNARARGQSFLVDKALSADDAKNVSETINGVAISDIFTSNGKMVKQASAAMSAGVGLLIACNKDSKDRNIYECLLDFVYPVGSFYLSTDEEVNPQNFLGGSWEVEGPFSYADNEGNIYRALKETETANFHGPIKGIYQSDTIMIPVPKYHNVKNIIAKLTSEPDTPSGNITFNEEQSRIEVYFVSASGAGRSYTITYDQSASPLTYMWRRVS